MDDKTAFNLSAFTTPVADAAKSMPSVMAHGLASGAALGMIAAVPMAASKIWDAATKRRDFRAMLRANEDLEGVNPAHVNAGFSLLRRFNADLTKDPYVAGSFVRNFAADPTRAFGMAEQALAAVPKTPTPGAFGRAFSDGASQGMQRGYDALKPSELEKQVAIERAREQVRRGGMPARLDEAREIERMRNQVRQEGAGARYDEFKQQEKYRNRQRMEAEHLRASNQAGQSQADAQRRRELAQYQAMLRVVGTPSNMDSSPSGLTPHALMALDEILHSK